MPIMRPLFFLLIIFSMASFKLSYSINFCPETEKQSLIIFKQSLEDSSNKLSSWNISGEVNCCKWKGVFCNKYTGHVHKLRLGEYSLGGKIDPSLLNLKYLRYLDLSQNWFDQTIPSFIGSFMSLEYLNLSNAGFHGPIPHTIGNLSSLRTLSLESFLDVDSLEWLSRLSQLEHLNMNDVNMSRVGTNWIQVINTLSSLVELRFSGCGLDFFAPMNGVVNVSSLAILDLSYNEFQSADILKWIFQPSELTYLDLSSNNFECRIPSSSNTTKLQHIDLSYNHLNSTIPDWFYFCKDLDFVYIINNSLHDTISNAIANLSSLNTLYLDGNELSGKIPREIANLCKMKRLDLSSNMFEGEISDSFGNMLDCFLRTLEHLYLAENQLSGHLPHQFGEFRRLEALDVAINKLSGNFPESLGQLSHIVYLDIEHNTLQGVVSESHFANMTQLSTLYAGGNHLTLKVNPNWIPPFKLSGLSLRSWNLGIHFPSWLKTQKNINGKLDLSCTGISGQVPSWFWNISSQALTLNLSHNHLYGEIPHTGSYKQIYLSSNQYSGSLPRVANSVAVLDLSNNSFSGGISHFFCNVTDEPYAMRILNLERNQLTGELPDCWQKWTSLDVLNLGYNSLGGSIPNSIGFLAYLKSLNLYNNKFSGQVPFSIHNCTELVKIDLANNDLDGSIPTLMGTSLHNLRVLILRSNKLSGKISPDMCKLNSLQILDLSDNKFSGTIPRCVDNFTAMATKRSLAEYGRRVMDYFIITLRDHVIIQDSALVSTKGRQLKYDTILSLVTNIDLSNNYLSGEIPKQLTSLVELRSLNLSGNHLTGLIPDRIGEMKQLESLDLSRNFLCGEIPKSFTGMSSLNYLNLSCNNLTGRIPESTQIWGFDSSSFIGNNLCGLPLLSNCSNDVLSAPSNKKDIEGNRSEVDWFYILLSLGYAVGFSIVCTMLIFKKSWREAYFELLEDLWNKVYVYIYSKWRRFTER